MNAKFCGGGGGTYHAKLVVLFASSIVVAGLVVFISDRGKLFLKEKKESIIAKICE